MSDQEVTTHSFQHYIFEGVGINSAAPLGVRIRKLTGNLSRTPRSFSWYWRWPLIKLFIPIVLTWFSLETLWSRAVLTSSFEMTYYICICRKDQKQPTEKDPGPRGQSSSLVRFGKPRITENIVNQIRKGRNGWSITRSKVSCLVLVQNCLCLTPLSAPVTSQELQYLLTW